MQKNSGCSPSPALRVIFLLALVVGVTTAVAESQVTVTVDVTGDAVPGATVTAMATIEIGDGSELQSIMWTQAGGADAMLSGATTDTVTVTLGPEQSYRDELIHVLSEPPIGEDQLPSNVPLPEGEFPGGLQDRFQIVGTNPFALEHAALVTLDVEVVTSFFNDTATTEIYTHLSWKPAHGIHNVPIGLPVLLHGKYQSHYDWMMSPPSGSAATLIDANSQSPWFTPDVSGRYWISVTDEETGESVSLNLFAGTWEGIIVDQDDNGRPIADQSCFGCHNDQVAPEYFSDWAQTGHAEIFTNNLNTSPYWGERCFACHTVGFDPSADNAGIDEASDYHDFLESGLIGNPSPDNWTQTLEQFPETARKANIQCENCHGPQNGGGHTQEGMRVSLSSDVCAPCHGEPLRHARFQQWQLSAHANYEVAIDEGGSGNCSRCHTGNGFLTWLPVLLGDEPGDPLDSIDVTWTDDEVHPQTCQTCHDPHNIGTTSGSDPNATVRISGDTPPLIAGFTATDVGRGAICMTCHNTRRGLRNDDTFDDFYMTSEAARAPHGGAQADVIMGQNAYLVEVGIRGKHSNLEDTCVDCHMEATPPPDDLAYNQGGTNHTFYARNDICGECHSFESGEEFQADFEEKMDELQALIEEGLYNLMSDLIDEGGAIDLNGDALITDIADVSNIEFGETRGRQAMTVTFGNGESVGPTRMTDIEVVPAVGSPFDIYDAADPILIKSGWNWNLFHNDSSHGVHNPSFAVNTVEVSTTEIIEAGIADGGGGPPGGVACDSDFVFWTEIVARNSGVGGSEWLTDLVVRNKGAATADLTLILHRTNGDNAMEGMVGPGVQFVFEDVVGMMGVEGKGSLQICSSQPLELLSRVYNQTDTGTFGTTQDGFPAGEGLDDGESARLIGLRQQAGAFRTNISFTNTGSKSAEVEVSLNNAAGTSVHTYNVTIPAGMVVQDLEPFRTRAERPNIGWCFASVEVISGSGILSSGTVIDANTNDGNTIHMKR
jgi:hypothetical protein